MKHGIWVAASLLLAAPAGALAQRAGAAEKAAEASAPRKAASKKAAKAKEPATPEVSPAAKRLARQTKSIFIFAVESCARAESRCDEALRNDAELRFMNACGACTTSQRCEEERDAIRAGEGRASRHPCGP
jgi:hypothetical protein